MAASIILKISVFTPILFSIILALDIEEDINTYFNDELNEPPPQMETFNNYEEMRKFLENNSNVELIDNPTFDTYLSAYNLHHNKDNKPEPSQSLSMKKRIKRHALPFPYDFIKFELADAREPDEATREALTKYRERERKNKGTVDTLKERNETKTEIPEKRKETIRTTTQKIITVGNKNNSNSLKSNKTRRITRRIPRKKSNQNSSPIKRIDMNLEQTSDDLKTDDLEIHETQNIHYYAAVPSGEGVSKHKISNIFPHEVQKAIDFVLAEKKPQSNVNGAPATTATANGKGANLKYIQIPIYHKQPYYGDKIALYQATKVSNKHQSTDYDEAFNKYLHSYSLPTTTANNDFKKSPIQSEHNNAAEERKNFQYNIQKNHQDSHHYYHNQYQQQGHQQQEHPKYYTIQTNPNTLPLHHENSLQEIKQSTSTSSSSVPTSQIFDGTIRNNNSGHIKTGTENLALNNHNSETGALTALPEISQVHTIHPQAVAVKIIPEINYVFHQDIAASPVSLKLEKAAAAGAIPLPSDLSAATYQVSIPIQISTDDSSSNIKSAQPIEVEKSVIPHFSYKNYKHHVYTPISLQNEMLAKAVLINHGYKFDDSTNSAGSSSDVNSSNISGKNNIIEASDSEIENLNEKYTIKSSSASTSSSGIPSQSYILSTTPSSYYHSYIESSTPSIPLQQHEQYHPQILSVTNPGKYILKNEQKSTSDSYSNNNYNNNDNNKEFHFETSSLSYKELSSLIGKSPTDQMHGLNYLIEKELQNNKLAKDKIRPQDSRAPILFHPNQKNGGDTLKGKNVYINEYGYKQIKNDNSASSVGGTTSTEKPIKEEENHHDINSVVHITPQPPSSHKHVYNLSPNYKFGTRLYGLPGFKDTNDAHGLQYASKYAFGYRVRDFHTGNDFGHKQKQGRDGVTRGEYHILLPDGRIQNVHYTADDSGFHADVSFETGS